MKKYLFKAKDVINDTGHIVDLDIEVIAKSRNGAFNRALHACYISDIKMIVDLKYYDLSDGQKYDLIYRQLNERKKDITFISEQELSFTPLPKTINSHLVYH